MGWYDSKRKTLDVDSSKISTSGALTAKAISDAFMGVAQVVEDRKKTDLLEKDFKLKEEKSKLDLDKAYQDVEQKAIDDTYLKYVDTNTGEFKQDEIEKDNVGLPINQVSLEAKTLQQNLKDAYTNRFKQQKDEDNKAAANEIASVMLSSETKEDFMKNINPETFKKADAQSLLGIESFYNKKANELAQINNAKENLSNQTKLSKLEIDLQKEKLKNETGKPREVKAADDSLIAKNIANYFGKADDFGNFFIEEGDAKDAAIKVSSRASEIFKASEGRLSHNEASALAIDEYQKSKETKPDPTPLPKDEKVIKKNELTNEVLNSFSLMD